MEKISGKKRFFTWINFIAGILYIFFVIYSLVALITGFEPVFHPSVTFAMKGAIGLSAYLCLYLTVVSFPKIKKQKPPLWVILGCLALFFLIALVDYVSQSYRIAGSVAIKWIIILVLLAIEGMLFGINWGLGKRNLQIFKNEMRKDILILKSSKNTFYIISSILLFLLFVFIHCNILLQVPRSGLDPSWQLITNWVHQKGIQFGNNYIFTYGPLGFLQVPIFPEFRFISFFYSILLLISLWHLFIIRNKQSFFSVCLFVFFTQWLDLYSFYPYLFCISSLLLFYNVKNKKILFISIIYNMLVGGSLVYVKFMYLPIVILTAFLIDIYLYYVRNRKILALPVFIVSLLVSWLLAGQKLRNIFSFFKLSLSVTKGYTEAMISGRPFPFLIFGIAIFILFLLIIKSYTIQNKKHKILERILFTLGCSISLFLAFKHGFVRHDGHVLLFFKGSYIVACTFLILDNIDLKNKIVIPSFLSILIFCVYLGGIYSSNSIPGWNTIKNSFCLTQRIVNKKQQLCDKQYEKRFIERYSSLRLYNKNIFADKTVDIYPWDQAEVIASDLNYKPRPLPQSYSCYTPELLELNAKVLISDPPDFILWQVKEIDNRLPSLMDGASWPAVLGMYTYYPENKNNILLSKQKNTNPLELVEQENIQCHLEESISLPQIENKMLWAQVDIKYTFIGKLLSLLWRPPTIDIDLELPNKHIVKRVIPGMMKTPFLLSPYIENTDDFRTLLLGGCVFSPVKDIKYTVNLPFFDKVINRKVGKKKIYEYFIDNNVKVALLVSEFPSQENISVKTIWKLSENDSVRPLHHINKIEYKDDSLYIQSVGRDPYLRLPPLPMKKGVKYALKIKANGPSMDFEIFYLTPETGYYNGNNRISFNGDGAFVLLPDNMRSDNVRLDTGTKAGEYVIKQLELLEIQERHHSELTVPSQWILNSDNYSQIKALHHIDKITFEKGTVKIHSTGNDPYLKLPPLPMEAGKQYALSIKATGPSDNFQLFYLTPQDQHYSEQNSIRFKSDDDFIVLPKNILYDNLRLDTGNKEGTYAIEKLEFFEVEDLNK